jgi:hypothetical protein
MPTGHPELDPSVYICDVAAEAAIPQVEVMRPRRALSTWSALTGLPCVVEFATVSWEPKAELSPPSLSTIIDPARQERPHV